VNTPQQTHNLHSRKSNRCGLSRHSSGQPTPTPTVLPYTYDCTCPHACIRACNSNYTYACADVYADEYADSHTTRPHTFHTDIPIKSRYVFLENPSPINKHRNSPVTTTAHRRTSHKPLADTDPDPIQPPAYAYAYAAAYAAAPCPPPTAGHGTLLRDRGHHYALPPVSLWPSRDPIGEQGGLNLYGFVENDGVGRIDRNGLKVAETPLILNYSSDHIELGECGYFVWDISWIVSPDSGRSGGLILQEMKVHGKDDNGKVLAEEHYYEGWRVKEDSNEVGTITERDTTGIQMIDPDTGNFIPTEPGGRFKSSIFDTWNSDPHEGTSGEMTFDGWARYRQPISQQKMIEQLPNRLRVAGRLPSRQYRDGKPKFPNSKMSNLIYRHLRVSWCCKAGATKEERATKIEEALPNSYNPDRTPHNE